MNVPRCPILKTFDALLLGHYPIAGIGQDPG